MDKMNKLHDYESFVLNEIFEKLEEDVSPVSKKDKAAELFECLGLGFIHDKENYKSSKNSKDLQKYINLKLSRIWDFVENGYGGEIDEDNDSLEQFYPYIYKGIKDTVGLMKFLKNNNHKLQVLRLIQVLCTHQIKEIVLYQSELNVHNIRSIPDGIALLSSSRFGNGRLKFDMTKLNKLIGKQDYEGFILELIKLATELDVFNIYYLNENIKHKNTNDPKEYITVFTVLIYLSCVEYSKSLI